jgi:hypothetical protein
MQIWGMPPGTFILFAILISFAAFSVIMERAGYTVTDDEGNKESITRYLLGLGTIIAVAYSIFGVIANFFGSS